MNLIIDKHHINKIDQYFTTPLNIFVYLESTQIFHNLINQHIEALHNMLFVSAINKKYKLSINLSVLF